MNKKFFSKIILFGEYCIIYNNSKCLSIPYKSYYGYLNYNNNNNNKNNNNDNNNNNNNNNEIFFFKKKIKKIF
ncbi:hypothetical protein [Candidatus Shikimatogenerans silvanidophilus]|uniref:hypothetical protein n=1 Tax=Candidatus Shikimatogenerans silvanidophilus TaxID=2782547 RepID=UPI001BA7CD59|nr:hypothetical protein [Candidatus Shikimatogenerans silvanidophilus]